MGVMYFVEPFDDAEREWLEAEGVEMPRKKQSSRNPTPKEVRTVCDEIEGCRVKYTSSAKNKWWQADVESTNRRGRDRWASLTIEKWGGSEDRRYKIMFEKGDPALVLRIVHGLSAHCGPLLVTPDSYPPLVVWQDADPKKLIRAWK